MRGARRGVERDESKKSPKSFELLFLTPFFLISLGTLVGRNKRKVGKEDPRDQNGSKGKRAPENLLSPSQQPTSSSSLSLDTSKAMPPRGIPGEYTLRFSPALEQLI